LWREAEGCIDFQEIVVYNFGRGEKGRSTMVEIIVEEVFWNPEGY
jgi:hypothetical protein